MYPFARGSEAGASRFPGLRRRLGGMLRMENRICSSSAIEQHLWRHRRAAAAGIDRFELYAHAGQQGIHKPTARAAGVTGRYPLFEADVAEHRPGCSAGTPLIFGVCCLGVAAAPRMVPAARAAAGVFQRPARSPRPASWGAAARLRTRRRAAGRRAAGGGRGQARAADQQRRAALRPRQPGAADADPRLGAAGGPGSVLGRRGAADLPGQGGRAHLRHRRRMGQPQPKSGQVAAFGQVRAASGARCWADEGAACTAARARYTCSLRPPSRPLRSV